MAPHIGMHARGRTLQDSIDNARAMESGGIRSVWVGDSSYDAYVHCAALAANTTTIELGTAVTLLTRSPLAAVNAATGLDELSDGRFTLGLGVGPNEWNRDWHGIDPARPARRVAEYLQCFKAAWASTPEHPAHVDGEIYRIRDYVRPRRSRSANLPVLVGVVGPLSTRNAAQYGDGVIFDIELPRSYIERVGLPALQEGARRAGKTMDQLTVGGLMALSVDPDRATARRRARHNIIVHVPVHYYIPVFDSEGFGAQRVASAAALERGDLNAALDAITDDMVDAMTIAGTPDEVLKQVAWWGEVLGLMIMSTPGRGLPADEADVAHRQAVELFSQ